MKGGIGAGSLLGEIRESGKAKEREGKFPSAGNGHESTVLQEAK